MNNLKKTEAGAREELVPTPAGAARLDWFPARGQPRAVALLGPGSALELLGTGRPTLIIQGGSDPFGRPAQFPPLPPQYQLVEIPGANHMFATSVSTSRPAPLEQLTSAARRVDRQAAAPTPQLAPLGRRRA
jgi:pimeloyl-ACP methyl ester carboxylesterase